MEEKRPLTKTILQAAVNGDAEAVDAVLAYYSGYIDSLCVRTSRKRNGTLVTHVDEDMRNQIKHMFLRDLPNMKWEELP